MISLRPYRRRAFCRLPISLPPSRRSRPNFRAGSNARVLLVIVAVLRHCTGAPICQRPLSSVHRSDRGGRRDRAVAACTDDRREHLELGSMASELELIERALFRR